jgi:NAD(P)-dependent dehydrogenase (short-subunit alcohol dehydrogenase family)
LPTCLVTGSNRGIGLEFVRQYAADGWRVIAACRTPVAAHALEATAGDIHIHALEVRDPARIRQLAAVLARESIDLLINNAGIGERPTPGIGGLDPVRWMDILQVNTIAPVLVAEAFFDHVAASQGRKIVAVTSRMSSIAGNTTGSSYAYRSSKAGLNMAYRSLSHDGRKRGIAVGLLNPGHVRTDMGGSSAPVAVDDSVAGMRRVIANLDLENTGRLWSYDGTELDW